MLYFRFKYFVMICLFRVISNGKMRWMKKICPSSTRAMESFSIIAGRRVGLIKRWNWVEITTKYTNAISNVLNFNWKGEEMPDNLGNSLANLDKRFPSEVFNFHFQCSQKQYQRDVREEIWTENLGLCWCRCLWSRLPGWGRLRYKSCGKNTFSSLTLLK